MTCTTHHICDCLKERMEKLEHLRELVREMYIPLSLGQRQLWTPFWLEKYDVIGRAIAALDSIGGGDE